MRAVVDIDTILLINYGPAGGRQGVAVAWGQRAG